MRFMKIVLAGYAFGVCSVLLGMLYLGGETLVQVGLKMSAASASYDFVAQPRDTVQATYDTRELLAYESPKVPAKKGARR